MPTLSKFPYGEIKEISICVDLIFWYLRLINCLEKLI